MADENSKMRLKYNAPVILTFSLACALALLIDKTVYAGFIQRYLTVGTSLAEPLDWFRLFGHIAGHASWGHFYGNLLYLLLLGPIVEERYGSVRTLVMVLITAVVTGLINVFFMSSGLLGASGIVFMLIILASIVNVRRKEIPITFIAVIILFLGQELLKVGANDNVSHWGHLVGGATGGALGFWHNNK